MNNFVNFVNLVNLGTTINTYTNTYNLHYNNFVIVGLVKHAQKYIRLSCFYVSAFLYLLFQLGHFKNSLEDLNLAISNKPTFSDAYWHRHLLFLIQGDYKKALEDLTHLLKQNKKHFGALRSKAALLIKKGDLSSAVYNISQAIVIHPNDPELYFARAEIYEKVTNKF